MQISAGDWPTLAEAWSQYRKNLVQIVILTTVGLCLGDFNLANGSLVFQFARYLIGLILSCALYLLLVSSAQGEALSINALFKRTLLVFPRFVWVFVRVFPLFLVGFVLFIVPGLYLMAKPH
jgi:hypothetical protein